MVPPLTAAERLRRSRRDQREYRARSFARCSQARFRRDLAIVPHLFLAPDALVVAPLLRPPEEVLLGLGERAVWTLDTAARERLFRDLLGTFGWRPELLTRLEDLYPAFCTEAPAA